MAFVDLRLEPAPSVTHDRVQAGARELPKEGGERQRRVERYGSISHLLGQPLHELHSRAASCASVPLKGLSQQHH
eukprot:scaffold22737_cov32-Tisochrysis_lutea.AAC.3